MSRRRTCLLMLGLLTAAPLAQALSPAAAGARTGLQRGLGRHGPLRRRRPVQPAAARWHRVHRQLLDPLLWRAWPPTSLASQCSTAASAAPEVRDSTWYADRIVVPYAPCKVFFYAGDNDSTVAAAQCRCATTWLPSCSACIATCRRPGWSTCRSPSPSRAHLLPAINEANTLIKAALAKLPNTGFTDIYTPMLGADGQPDATLFREDMLHMTPAGYDIWTRRWRRRSTATEQPHPRMAWIDCGSRKLSKAGRCGFAGPLAPWMAPSSPMDGFTACPANPYRPAIPRNARF